MTMQIIIINTIIRQKKQIHFHFDSLSNFKLKRKDILKPLIIKCQMPVNSFGYLLCIYVWLQTEAVCVCVHAHTHTLILNGTKK